ncbi:uncharacterized protein DS421_8g237860 [Arachis hypogaea]|nr:uncharacterized protein DS421_8g237860 [Arachis hypogaea]
MLQLARAYDVETNTLRVDAGDIRITAELIVNVFGIPSQGDPIPVLYFHRLKHGPLHACRVPEPWIVEWTTNELDKKADHVIS